METLYKNKLLVWTTVALLLINVGTLTTFWVASQEKDRNKERGKIRNARIDEGVLVNELHLTTEQIEFYKNARKIHFKEIRGLRDKIENNHRLIHQELFNETTDTLRMIHLADSIGLLNAQFEKANFNHFITLKTQLSAEQCKRFQNIMDEVSNRDEREDRMQHRKNMH
jgi:hypothetical protein